MDNCVTTTKKLLKLLGIGHTTRFLEDAILSHPDHPSLLCIADTLEKYHIENLAVKIDGDKLQEVPLPCIVQVSERGNRVFSVLEQLSDNQVCHLNSDGKRNELTKEEFLKKWTGICLLAEKSKESVEPGIEKRLYTQSIMTFLTAAVTALLILSSILTFTNSEIIGNNDLTIYSIAYSLLKVVGLGTGILLLWYEVDQYNPTLQSFCSGGGKINCNAVLNSDKAQLLNGNLSLSLLGFSYFFASLGFLLFSGFDATSFGALGILSLTMIPVVLLSAYYQAMVIKQWCKFCIIVQAVLVFEIVTVVLGSFYTMPLVFENIPMLLALFFLPVLAWKLVKPLLEKEKETNLYKRGLKKIKNNPDVLMGLLSKSKKISTPVDDLGISLTNTNAKYNVIKVCNPYCGPCAKAHPILENLFKQGSINLQILFTTKADDNRMAKPVRHLLAIDAEGDKTQIQLALDAWYNAERKDYDAFANNFPMNGELVAQNKKITDMYNWCETELITHTPTLFINGNELPNEYKVEDLEEVLV